jgi:hypothetical protein
MSRVTVTERRRTVFVVVAGVIALMATLSVAAASAAAPCCFVNDRYEGVCTVVPGEGESCGGILGYLNNPMSTGKSYCDGTSVRGGWVSVGCKASSVSQQGAAAPKARSESAAPAREGPASK